MNIILASGSPRRKELLAPAGFDFEVEVSNADENVAEESPTEMVEELAARKAEAVVNLHNKKEDNCLVIGADTIVVLDGKILGKPADEADARAMLASLSGRTHQVYTGVGSDDVLAIAFLTFFNSGKPILFPDITYSFYDVWAELFQVPYERPALDDAFALRLEDYQCENGGIVIANPNAPTGIRQSEEFLRAVIEANPNVVVIIDEAYADFSGYTALPLVDEYENVVVVQTFSKSRSMAGMRIGHAIGNAKLIKAMNDVRYSFNSYPMTRLSVALGVAALSDQDYFEETTAKIVATRERTKQALTELGFTFGDSMTNFIFATHKTVPATHLFEELRKQHIFVRHFSSPRIDNYLRISIGTDAEMDRFLAAVQEIIAQWDK